MAELFVTAREGRSVAYREQEKTDRSCIQQ